MTGIPPEAITAAAQAIGSTMIPGTGFLEPEFREPLARRAVEAAAPHIAAAERERLAAEMPTVVIQVSDGGIISEAEWNTLGDRLKAAWHEHIDAAVAAERERIRQLALDLDAQAWDNRGPYTRVPFADLLGAE